MTEKLELTAQEKLDRAVELLDSAQALVQDALEDTDAGYNFTTQLSHIAAQIHTHELVDVEDTRTIELTVRVKIRASADVQDVVSNCNYDFAHEDIVETEIVDVNTEI
jgi:hypothetical protein